MHSSEPTMNSAFNFHEFATSKKNTRNKLDDRIVFHLVEGKFLQNTNMSEQILREK